MCDLWEDLQAVTLGDLIKNMPVGRVEGDSAITIEGISKDSRKVGKGFLFFVTPKSEPHIPEAIRRGAGALVTSSNRSPDFPTIVTTNNVDALLGLVAARFYGNPSSRLHVTGITGTNGKTTTSFLIESIFEKAGRKTGVIGTISYRFDGRTLQADNTTPGAEDLQKLLGEMLSAGVDSAVMEVSSHALDQRRVEGVDFDTVVFTNLTHDHLDYHGTIDQYREAKRLFFHHYIKVSQKERRHAVLNLDDPSAEAFIPGEPVRPLFYSLSRPADAHLIQYSESIEGLQIRLSLLGDQLTVKSPLLGRFNILNILAACLAGHAAAVPKDVIAEGITALDGVPGRLERVRNGKGLPVFIDYAHTPDALEQVLGLLRGLKQGRLLLLFGCGGDRDRAKRPVMGEIASRLADFTILTSDNPRTEDPPAILSDIRRGFTGKSCRIIEDRRDAIYECISMASENDVILVAGKGHEDYQIIGTEKHHFSDREVVEDSFVALG
jgi:UDP-N-acetylmuramoyl-L-alanyl-D-glutamate--2,6-diaminopimelate ligase